MYCIAQIEGEERGNPQQSPSPETAVERGKRLRRAYRPAQRMALTAWQEAVLYFVAGIFVPADWMAALGSALTLGAAMRMLRGRALRPVVALGIFISGAVWALIATPHPDMEAPPWMLAREKIELSGVVRSVETRPGQRIVAVLGDVECLRQNGEAWRTGSLLGWTWDMPSRLPVSGDRVRLATRLRPVRGFLNSGQWDAAAHYGRQGIGYRAYSRGNEAGISIEPGVPEPAAYRDAFRRWVSSLVPPTQGGAMLSALLTGDRFLLSPATVDLVRRAGLSHTLALSGQHLGYVAMFGWAAALILYATVPGLGLRIPRPKAAVLLSTPLVLAYAWIGQPAPSLTRSACMFATWAVLLLLGRGRIILDGLFLAVAVILVVSPQSGCDVGLQLSAAAVGGLAVFFPFMRRAFGLRRTVPAKVLGAAADLLLLSLAANMAILPIAVRHFGTFSPNLLTNVVWLPVLGFLVMPLGFLGTLLHGLAQDWAGNAAFGLAAGLCEALLSGLGRLDAAGVLPLPSLLRPLWPELLGCGLLLAVLASGPRRGSSMCACVVGLALMAVPHFWVMHEDCRGVSLEVLDVGQGQAVLLRGPHGGRWLVDGGGLSSPFFDVGESVVAPALTLGRPPRLEGVVLTHPDRDHAQGLQFILRSFQVGIFIHNGDRFASGEDGLAGLGVSRALSVAVARTGDRYGLGGGVFLDVLHPPCIEEGGDRNKNSLVLRLAWDGRGLALLCGDATPRVQAALARNQDAVRSDVLVLSHHGSDNSICEPLYRAVAPSYALASTGYLNAWGFPGREVADALRRLHVPLLATGDCGAVRAAWIGPGARPSVEAAQGGKY